MLGSYSQESLKWLQENYGEFLNSRLYDFVSCQRPDGSVYGTAGTCRKGSEIERRREESIKHLNNSLALLKEKRDNAPPEHKPRITRLIDKLEADLKAIQGESKLKNTPTQSGTKNVAKKDLSHLKPEKSRNDSYGFMGSSREYHSSGLQERWKEASKGLQTQGIHPTHARRILDSPWGRHLADELGSAPNSEVKSRVENMLKNQSSFGRREFNKLIKKVMAEGYDD